MEVRGQFSKASVRDARVAGKRVLVRSRLQRAARRTASSRTTPGSGPRVPTIELLRERGRRRRALLAPRPAGGSRPRALDGAGRRAARRAARRLRRRCPRRRRRRGRGASSPGSTRARCCCSRTPASSPGETSNDPELAEALAGLADLYVNDAFGAAHRAHASTEGVAHHLPAYAGLLLEREVRELTSVLDDPERPLVVVLGGAKVSDKIGVIDRFLEIADQVLIGGAMCFSFFSAPRATRPATRWSRRRASSSPATLLERAERVRVRADCCPPTSCSGDGFSAEAEPRSLTVSTCPTG